MIAKAIARKKTQETGKQELFNLLSENDKGEETGLKNLLKTLTRKNLLKTLNSVNLRYTLK